MPRPRSAMRKIREVLRLGLGEGLTARQVAGAVGIPRTTAHRYLTRAAAAGVGWPLPEDLDDVQLERRLFGRPGITVTTRPVPDWAKIHLELKRKGVTLQLLWDEDRQTHPDGYQYSQWCLHYHRWARRLDLVMRQDHRAGERLFVDFAGPTVPIVDPQTGEITEAQIFVAVMGASNFTYAEALVSQEMPHWISAHVHAFQYMGAVPAVVVCDNLRSGVKRAHRYEPEVNRSYLEMATHYGCVVMPARAKKPRDKAKAEAGVLVAERWILASLRNQTFFSLAELNAAIRERLEWLQDRPFKKLQGSRRSLFQELDKPAMRPLPDRPYQYGQWKRLKVSIDYHLDVFRHYYSVPYQLVGERVDVRVSATTVEVFRNSRRVASHARSFIVGGHTTLAEHMPDSHRRHQEWTPGRIVRWAENTGPATAALVEGIMRSRPHPEQGFRSCLGIFQLGRRYGRERLEAASTRALAVEAYSYRSVESILRTGLDREPQPPRPVQLVLVEHENVRGPNYYE